MEKREALFIGGEWVSAASGKVIEVINPYTEEVMGSAPEACQADVDAAVAAAQEALAAGWWRQTTPDERADMISAIGHRTQKRSDVFMVIGYASFGSL